MSAGDFVLALSGTQTCMLAIIDVVMECSSQWCYLVNVKKLLAVQFNVQVCLKYSDGPVPERVSDLSKSELNETKKT